MRLVLASTSPRRKKLLTLLGLPFEVMSPPFVEQVMPDLPADRQVCEFAEGKARSCMPPSPDALIFGSDTLISLGSEVLGKPRNLRDADAMLRRMAGQTHTIFTAVALTACHLFEGAGDDGGMGLAPELASFGSHAWVSAQIKNPASKATYRENALDPARKGHMPAFGDELSPADIDLLARWVLDTARR